MSAWIGSEAPLPAAVFGEGQGCSTPATWAGRDRSEEIGWVHSNCSGRQLDVAVAGAPVVRDAAGACTVARPASMSR